MRCGLFALAVVGACSFRTHELANPGDGRVVDVPIDMAGSAGSAYRKPIVIHKMKIGAPVDDFPVWIDVTDADIAARAQADGHDIFFTDAAGTALDHELASYSTITQRLRAWVRVPHLDMTADATIYVVYGDPVRAVAENPKGVFTSSFAAVWHLDDSLSATVIDDATGTHAGTATGLSTAARVDGQLGSGFNFDGSGSAYVSFANPLSGSMAHTISAWVNQAATAGHSAIVAVGSANMDQARFLYGHYLGSNTLAIGQYSDDWQPAGYDLRGQGWTLVHYTLEGPNKKAHVFVNGVEIAGSPHTMGAMAATSGTTGLIGIAPPGFGITGMVGTLDEVRIATVARSPGWCATEFANQSSPSTFYAVGAEELAP
jgi:hypothetical protein